MKFISVLLKENTKINICCFLLDFNFNIIEKNYNFVNNFNQTLIYITEKPPPLLRGSLAKIVTFGTKHFVCYSRHVRYLGNPSLGGFTV